MWVFGDRNKLFSQPGVARGSGRQDIGAYINLGAYYLCGIPVAAVLGFFVGLRGVGLWIGILVGSFVQTVLLSILTVSTNWEEQVSTHLYERCSKQ